ncbi:MAG: cell division protein FtsX [Alphaproteobacteria bacterium]
MTKATWSLPLGGDPTDRFLPWIIGLMVFLAALALATAMALGGAAQRWRASLDDVVTVELPALADEAEPRLDATLAALRALPDVASAEPVPADEIAALIEPWVGAAVAERDLPLPDLIDVRLRADAERDGATLRAALADVAPDARVDASTAWLAPLARTADTTRLIGYAIVVLIVLAGIATVVFTSTTGLAVHHNAIELLHLIGAEDGFIARQFQRQALVSAFIGGAIGLILAIAAFRLIGRVASSMQAPLLPRLELELLAWAIMAGLPLAAALLAMFVARLTVLRALARLP